MQRTGLIAIVSTSLLALSACGDTSASELEADGTAATEEVGEDGTAGETAGEEAEAGEKAGSATRAKAPKPQTGARTVDCELTVEGTTYIDGECEFTPMGSGDFQISGGDYFAQVDVESKGKAQGFWNEEKGASHTQSPLGALTQKGGCWVGSKVKICANNLSAKDNAARDAARPKGMMLYPDVAGASSSCLSLQGGAKIGSKLVLRSCSIPNDLIFVKKSDGELSLYGKPDLCLGFGDGLALTKCSPYAAVWETQATSTKSAVVSTSDGGCIAIPDLERASAKFPFAVEQVDCAEESRTVKFFMAKD